MRNDIVLWVAAFVLWLAIVAGAICVTCMGMNIMAVRVWWADVIVFAGLMIILYHVDVSPTKH